MTCTTYWLLTKSFIYCKDPQLQCNKDHNDSKIKTKIFLQKCGVYQSWIGIRVKSTSNPTSIMNGIKKLVIIKTDYLIFHTWLVCQGERIFVCSSIIWVNIIVDHRVTLSRYEGSCMIYRPERYQKKLRNPHHTYPNVSIKYITSPTVVRTIVVLHETFWCSKWSIECFVYILWQDHCQ